MFKIRRYTSDDAAEWNRFVAQSKNGTFLFNRGYMDYHADRFEDYSLMFSDSHGLCALLPANKVGHTLYSHQGLTYGGVIVSEHAKTIDIRDIFILLNSYLAECGFRHVIYKHIPWIYAHVPSEEDLYALTMVCHASLKTRHVASVVDFSHRVPFCELRTRGVKKAQKEGIVIRELNDFTSFWHVLEDNLSQRFSAHPVHSINEISLLKQRFPDRIRLFAAIKDERILGGAVLYQCGQTIKTQYISADEEGKQLGVLDLLFDRLLCLFYQEDIRYFDFGTSNGTDDGSINEGLIFQKEGFGGRAVCYDTYEWNL